MIRAHDGFVNRKIFWWENLFKRVHSLRSLRSFKSDSCKKDRLFFFSMNMSYVYCQQDIIKIWAKCFSYHSTKCWRLIFGRFRCLYKCKDWMEKFGGRTAIHWIVSHCIWVSSFYYLFVFWISASRPPAAVATAKIERTETTTRLQATWDANTHSILTISKFNALQ